MKISTSKDKWLKTIISATFWIIIWQILSIILGEEILLVSPLKTFTTLLELMGRESFWVSIATTLLKVTIGLSLGIVFGILMAVLGNRSELFKLLVHPIIIFFKSVPVAAFVILLLVWVDKNNLSIVISLMMSLPIIYSNMEEGIGNFDVELLEMASVFNISLKKRVKYIYMVQLKPFLVSGIIAAAGMCFKAGIAAEVIGLPKDTIGENLYNVKLFYNNGELFAWILAIMIISIAYEAILKFILSRGESRD